MCEVTVHCAAPQKDDFYQACCGIEPLRWLPPVLPLSCVRLRPRGRIARHATCDVN